MDPIITYLNHTFELLEGLDHLANNNAIKSSVELGTCLRNTKSENTHRRVNDHCTFGLQINWIGLDQARKYAVMCIH